MRRIGLLGGMSWESSAEYYRLLNELVRERLGGLHSADCLLYSVDFARIAADAARGSLGGRRRGCSPTRRGCWRPGARTSWCCAPTRCTWSPTRQEAVSIPLLHLARRDRRGDPRAGLTEVGLLGTAFTMEQAFYVERLASHGMTAQVPTADDRALVHRVIYDELCLGVVSDDSRRRTSDVIDRLVARGRRGDHPGLHRDRAADRPDDSPVPVFPTTRLHAEAAVDAALA